MINSYTLTLADQAPAAGDVPIEFMITDPNGRPVIEYDVRHEKELHLIAVRHDFTGYQHVHPRLAADGTWTTDLALTPGPWTIFTDFQAAGADPITLSAELVVAGDYRPRPPAAARTAELDDYSVKITADPTSNTDSILGLMISKDGRPVEDLQPYLGAYGHLIALREDDRDFLHVHPVNPDQPGPEILFHLAAGQSRYRLFLDFRHDDLVRTAALAWP